MAKGSFFRPLHMNYTHSSESRKRAGWIVLAFLPVLVTIVMWGNILAMNLQISKMSKERNELADRKSKLTLQLEAMTSNRHLEEVAIARYGFKKPSDGQVFVIKKKNSPLDVFAGLR